MSSQNVAMIRYVLPRQGDGFTITVEHVTNERRKRIIRPMRQNLFFCQIACNIIAADEIVHTLRNYGEAMNCTVTGMYMGKVKVLQTDIPVDNAHSRRYWYWGSRRREMPGLQQNVNQLNAYEGFPFWSNLIAVPETRIG